MLIHSLVLAALAFARTTTVPSAVLAPSLQQPSPAKATTSAEFLRDLYARLDQHAFFRSVDSTRVEDFLADGLVFIIQRPLKDKPNYAKDQATEYARWCRQLVTNFQREYVEPLGLVDNHTLPICAIAMLASRGDYDVNFADASNKDLNATRAHYQPDNRFVITYRDVMNGTGARSDRLPLLHELVHALQHRYSANPDRLPECAFFNEGLAEYLSNHLLDDPADLEKHRVDFAWVKELAPVILTPARDGYFLSIDALTTIKDYGELLDVVERQCNQNGIPFYWQLAMSWFYRESALYMYFLHQGKNGEYKARTGKFIQALLGGKSGGDAWKTGFDGVSAAQIDKEFVDHFAKVLKQEYPAFNPANFNLSAFATASNASAPVAAVVDPAKLVTALALRPDEREVRVARALCMAMGGQTTAAAAELEQCKDGAGDELRKRVATECARLKSWVSARDSLLASMAATKLPIEIKLDGKLIRGVVRALENGELVIANAANVEQRVSVETLTAVDLRDALKDKLVGDLEWLKIYPLCVSGDAKWKKLTMTPTPDVALLKADAEGSYPKLRALGIAAVGLHELAERAAPTNADEARSYVASIKSLWDAHGKVDCIAARSATLAQLACSAYDKIGETLDVAELVHVRPERLGGDKIRLKYSFQRADEALDFVAVDSYLTALRDDAPAISGTPKRFAVAGKQLRGVGAQCAKHVLEFCAPLTLRYTLRWEIGKSFSVDKPWMARAGVCGDVFENALLFDFPHYLLYVKNGAGRTFEELSSARKFHINETYRIELVHDGTRLSANLGGQNLGSIDAAGRTVGSVFFSIHSDYPVAISEVEIEGSVNDSSLAAARHAWAKQQGEALGIR